MLTDPAKYILYSQHLPPGPLNGPGARWCWACIHSCGWSVKVAGGPVRGKPLVHGPRVPGLAFSWASCAVSLSLQFVCVESLVTAVVDMYPKVFRRGYRRELLILALSIISYFLGLVMLTEVGGISRTLYQTPALRPQLLWLCTDPVPSLLLGYLLFRESEHRPSVSSRSAPCEC
jgi:hypothetical protein